MVNEAVIVDVNIGDVDADRADFDAPVFLAAEEAAGLVPGKVVDVGNEAVFLKDW